MLRVGLELTGLELDRTGSARAIGGLRAELERREDVEVVTLAHPPSRARTPRLLRGLAREAVWLPLRVPARARRKRLDVLHCPVGLAPAFGAAGVPLVVTVNDALALDHPEWFTRENVLQQRLVLGRALRRAAQVLTPSAHAADRVAARFGVDRGRIAVTPYGIDARFSPGPVPADLAERLGLEGAPWILTVGTLQPRKNLEGALAAFERLHADGVPHRLVVAGARGWGDDGLAARIAASHARDAIRLPGRVGDEDLVGLYRGAGALLFPSRGEGFGYPPLEAMACGTPVVSSDRGSLPEAVGDAGLLADPDDPDALAAAARRALDPQAAEDLRRRGLERAAGFTWERCAGQTVAAYRRAAARTG